MKAIVPVKGLCSFTRIALNLDFLVGLVCLGGVVTKCVHHVERDDVAAGSTVL